MKTEALPAPEAVGLGDAPLASGRRLRPLRWYWKLLASLALLPTTFFLADFALTKLMFATGIMRPQGREVIENIAAGPIVTFDASSGYRIGPKESRWVCIKDDGTVQSQGARIGNNLGFPDRHDFSPQRGDSARRIAVFGDSMTAAQFIPRNWPDVSERLLEKRDQSVELLNFAVDGGGIANWYGVLRDILSKEKYDIDGVLLAVYADDLYRGLYIMHDHFHDGAHALSFGRVPTMNPDRFPKTLDEAKRYLAPIGFLFSVSPGEMDDLIGGRATYNTRDAFALSKRLYLLYAMRHFGPHGVGRNGSPFDSDALDLIDRMAKILSDHHWPALVVILPTINREPVAHLEPALSPDKKLFAERIGAPMIDGSAAFADLSAAQLDGEFLAGDAHWNQKGSDRFAHWIVNQIGNWP